ncbi:MAG: dihydrodipicolinate reductase [Phycisphaerales bacterium]
MHRVLHIGLGPLGQMIAHHLHEREAGQIVAAVDLDPKLASRALVDAVNDFGEPRVARSIDDLPNEVWGEIDVVIVTTSSDLAKCAPLFRPLLERGLPIVSTCEELLWPYLRHPKLADELHALAMKWGGRLLGTGVNPGFVMDTLPVVVSAVSNRVDRVEIARIQDASTRREPFQRKIGAGLDLDEFADRVAAGTLRHVGLGESLHFVAHALGWRINRWRETIEPTIARRLIESDTLHPIQPGAAAGVRQVAEGFIDEESEPVLRLTFVASIGEENPHDRIQIDGEPSIDLVLNGGIHGDDATVAMVINMLNRVREAPRGLHTMSTIRLPRFTVSASNRPR